MSTEFDSMTKEQLIEMQHVKVQEELDQIEDAREKAREAWRIDRKWSDFFYLAIGSAVYFASLWFLWFMAYSEVLTLAEDPAYNEMLLSLEFVVVIAAVAYIGVSGVIYVVRSAFDIWGHEINAGIRLELRFFKSCIDYVEAWLASLHSSEEENGKPGTGTSDKRS